MDNDSLLLSAAGQMQVLGDFGGGQKAMKAPHLSDITISADRIENATQIIRDFNERFRPQPQLANVVDAKTPQTAGYAGDLARLVRAIDALVAATARLSDIG